MEEDIQEKPKDENEKIKLNLFSYKTLNKNFKLDENGFYDNDKVDKIYESQPYKAITKLQEQYPSFIEIMGDKKFKREERNFLGTGLKFHISLPEDDDKVGVTINSDVQDNFIEGRTCYSKGWDIVFNILIKHNIGHFKISHNNNRMSGKYPEGHPSKDVYEALPLEERLKKELQRGKDITIYLDSNRQSFISFENLIDALKEITTELVNAGIPPGYKPSNEGDRAESYIKGNNYVSYRYEGKAPEEDQFASIKKSTWPKNQLDNIKAEDTLNNQNNNQNNDQNDNCCSCKIV